MKTFTIEIPEDTAKVEIILVPREEYQKTEEKGIAILQSMADYFGISIERLKSDSRESDLVKVRQMFVAITNIYLRWTDSNVARLINRDRSTVINARKVFRERIQYDRQFKAQYTDLMEHLQEKFQLENMTV